MPAAPKLFRPKTAFSQKSLDDADRDVDVGLIRGISMPMTFSNGFFLESYTPMRFDIWWRKPDDENANEDEVDGERPESSGPIKDYGNRLRKIGTIQLMGESVRKLKIIGEWTIIITNSNRLLAYHHPASLFSLPPGSNSALVNANPNANVDSNISIGKESQVLPGYTTSLNYGIPPNLANSSVKTSIFTFDDQYIFYATNLGLRIQSRPSFQDASMFISTAGTSVLFEEVLFIREIPRKRIAPGMWTRSITSNTFYIVPSASPSLLPEIEQIGETNKAKTNGVKKEKIEKGTASRESRWTWKISHLVVADGMLIMTNGHWVVGIPDYEAVIQGRSLDEGAWALDLNLGNRRPCYGLVFDGRRLVCKVVGTCSLYLLSF